MVVFTAQTLETLDFPSIPKPHLESVFKYLPAHYSFLSPSRQAWAHSHGGLMILIVSWKGNSSEKYFCAIILLDKIRHMAKSRDGVGYYSAVKRTQMLIHTTYWMNLKDMLGKKSW